MISRVRLTNAEISQVKCAIENALKSGFRQNRTSRQLRQMVFDRIEFGSKLNDRTFKRLIRPYLTKVKIVIPSPVKYYWRYHHQKCLGYRVQPLQLRLQNDSSADTIDHVLQRSSAGSALNKAFVLCLFSIVNFNDQNMKTLIQLLQKHKQIFSVNLGEKPKVSNDSWMLLIENINSGAIGIRYGFADKKDCLYVKEFKAAMRNKRHEDNSTQDDPIWSSKTILNLLKDACPPGERSDNLAYGKPFWYKK
jgi:hypothetical protein